MKMHFMKKDGTEEATLSEMLEIKEKDRKSKSTLPFPVLWIRYHLGYLNECWRLWRAYRYYGRNGLNEETKELAANLSQIMLSLNVISQLIPPYKVSEPNFNPTKRAS
jgi:hypothetical protein